MENGISIYPGLDNTLAQNLQLIQQAAACGIRRLFTSLHIPETDPGRLKKELAQILKAARRFDMEIISDISPATMELLGIREFSPSAFRMLGITTLRLDYGFGLEEITALSRNRQGVRIQLNASTITGKILSALVELHANFGQIDALHNFYPRRGTGLSEEFLVRKTSMLHKLGIRTGAFVPCAQGRRGPLREGLPTLEEHREEDAGLAARHLVALGIDSVFLADSLPSMRELQAIAALRDDAIVLQGRMITKDPVQQQLLRHTFTARTDEARDAVRAQESRSILKQFGADISPDHTDPRPAGAITIDNRNYRRYMGELQIIRNAQPADPRVNVPAVISQSDQKLIPYITPGRKFSFLFD